MIAAGRMRRFFPAVPRRQSPPGNSARRTQHAHRTQPVNCASPVIGQHAHAEAGTPLNQKGLCEAGVVGRPTRAPSPTHRTIERTHSVSTRGRQLRTTVETGASQELEIASSRPACIVQHPHPNQDRTASRFMPVLSDHPSAMQLRLGQAMPNPTAGGTKGNRALPSPQPSDAENGRIPGQRKDRKPVPGPARRTSHRAVREEGRRCCFSVSGGRFVAVHTGDGLERYGSSVLPSRQAVLIGTPRFGQVLRPVSWFSGEGRPARLPPPGVDGRCCFAARAG